MATDAKIDQLIASLDKLVEALEKGESGTTGAPGSGRAAPPRARVIVREGEEIVRAYEREAEALEENLRRLESELDFRGRLSDQKQDQLNQMRVEQELLRELAAASDPADRDRLITQLEDLRDVYQDYNEEIGIGKRKSEELRQSILGISGEASKLARVMPTSIGELDGFVTETIEGIASGETFVRVLNKLISEGFNLSMALDQVNAELSRTTALFQQTGTIMDQQARVIRGVESSNRILGVTAQETAQAMGALQSSMADFTRMSKSDQESILNTATVMQELGISAGTSAQIFDKATKSLGYQNSQIRGIADDLHATAQSLGVPFSQIADDFNMVATELAFYGETAIDVFKDLSKQSKATGLSMQQLLKIGGQAFNTFDGAAQKVGRLNAILGGPYLNSIDMLNASEAERIDLIKQSMDASGQMFNDLSKYEQMAIADALGVSTEEARRLFGELDASQEMDIRQKEKMEETARKAQATMDKLKNAFMSLVVTLDPVVGLFSLIVEGFSDFINTPIIKQVMQITLYVLSFVGALKFLGVAVAASLFPVVGAIAAVVTVAMILYKHFKNLREAGASFGAIFVDMGQKVLLFMGPFGAVIGAIAAAISLVISFVRHLKSGQAPLEALKNTVFDFLNNISFGLLGKLFGFGSNVDRKSFGFNKPKSVNDAIITTDGQIIEPSKQDTIFAAKPGGPIMESLAGAASPLLGIAGMLGGPIMKGLLLAAAPLSNLAVETSKNIKEGLAEATSPLSDLAASVTSPILNLLGVGTNNNTTNNNTTNNNTMSQQPSNVNVVVKVGEKELRDIFIDVLRDTTASSEISGFGGR